MKGSIVKSIIIRVVIIFIILTVIFGIGFRHMIRNIVLKDAERHADTTMEMYINLVVAESVEKGLPLNDPEVIGNIDEIGEAMCARFGLDYVYIYRPSKFAGDSFLTSVASSKHSPDELKSRVYETYRNEGYGISEEEIAVWNGDSEYTFFTTDNDFGYEYDFIRSMYDVTGEKYLVGIDISYEEILSSVNARAVLVVFVTAAVLSLALVVFCLIIRKRIQKPAMEISRAMSDFSKNEGRTSEKLSESGNDEFSMISKSFNTMVKDINSYIEKIKKLDDEKATRNAELRVAGNIQKGILPPTFDARRGYEISAVMTPAKDIGGDLYDYINIDGENLLLVMADVSGKGIYASIIMAITLTLIRNTALSGMSPSEILESVNDTLSARNPENIFVTAFIAIFNTRTKTLTYSNAGHNLPYVIGETLITLEGGNVPIGLFGGEKYPSYSITLSCGDILYMYTDGVNEAVNKENKFFGVKALEELLAEHKTEENNDSLSVIDRVGKAISVFSEGAEQSDDITMLTLKLTDENKISLAPSLPEFEKIKEIILQSEMAEDIKLSMCLAAEEIFVNICSYAFEGIEADSERIRFSLDTGDKTVLTFEDGGNKYDPTESVTTADEYDVLSQLGGLGKLIAFSVSDEVKYEYKNGKNILKLIKNTEEK